MQIKKVYLKNYRNYNAAVAHFFDGINMVIGDNAQGKTNLLESIYFCALGKSPRLSKDNLLINYDKTLANINIDFLTKVGSKNIEINIPKQGKKRILINGASASKTSSLIGTMKIVYFSPDELRLIKEVPEDRRKFLDISISQIDKEYLYSLIRYEKVLKQRNTILKNKLDPKVTKSQLEIWNPQYVKLASKIIYERIFFIKKIEEIASDIHKKIFNNEKLNMYYSYENQTINFGNKKDENIEIIKNDLDKKIMASFDKDCKLGYSNVGPHRDDIEFLLNEKSCKSFCSQGQQRSVALSVKLAEMELFNKICGEYPILLLDDVLSELDDNRQTNLLKFISKYQSIITGTNKKIDINATKILINNGSVKLLK